MPKKYSGVTAAVGLPGSGKSYYLADQALKGIKEGLPVYSNAGFDVEGTQRLESFEDFAAVKGPAVVVWDELPLYFSARRWGDFPDGMLYKFTQIRKDSIRLYYSTIHPNMVDVTLRRITFEWVEHRHMTGRFVKRTHWIPGGFQSDAFVVSHRGIGILKRRVMDAYDTHGRVAVQQAERLETLPTGTWMLPGWASGDGSRLRVAPDAPEHQDEGQDSEKQQEESSSYGTGST